MKKSLKQKWVAALRSGKYQQVRGRLCTTNAVGENRYCCLGVLCEVADVPAEQGSGGRIFKYKHTSGIGNLPMEFRKDVNLEYEQQEALIEMNDCDRKSFTEIADYIERKVPEDAE